MNSVSFGGQPIGRMGRSDTFFRGLGSSWNYQASREKAPDPWRTCYAPEPPEPNVIIKAPSAAEQFSAVRYDDQVCAHRQEGKVRWRHPRCCLQARHADSRDCCSHVLSRPHTRLTPRHSDVIAASGKWRETSAAEGMRANGRPRLHPRTERRSSVARQRAGRGRLSALLLSHAPE